MRRGIAVFVLGWLGCSDPEAAPVVLTAGDTTIVIAVDGRSFELRHRGEKRASFPLEAFQLGLVNALDPDSTYDPYWLEHSDGLFQPAPPPDLRWRKLAAAKVTGGGERAEIEQTFEGGATGKLTIEKHGDRRFKIGWTAAAASPIAYVRVDLVADDPAFYGLGEWPDGIDHRGKLRPMQMEADLSIESANTENHVPIPLLLGSRGWGVFVKSRNLGLFDVARKAADLVEITYGTDALELHLFTEDQPLDLTKHYYQITGAPKLPARWAYGPLIWRDENESQAQLENDVRLIRELDLATTGIWIDRPYTEYVSTFDFDAVQFPDPASMVTKVHAAGLRIALWHVPYLESAAEPYRTEAVSAGYFVPEPGLRLNGWSDPFDFTNPAARAWWTEKLRVYPSLGFEGYKLDYAEDVIPGIGGARTHWRFFDESTELTMHHDYTVLYHQAYVETLPTEYLLLCRAARWGSQVYGPVIWPGDLDADFYAYGDRGMDREGSGYNAVGGLPTSLYFSLGLGPSGFPFYGADTGGYRHSPPDNEVFVRWFEQSTFSSVMQVGDSSSQPPWEYTAENGRNQATLDLYRSYARLHLRLFPYVWSYAERLKTDGRALMRPIGLAHPESGAHIADQYLLGDHLLVAPVIVRGQRSRDVKFPAGTWYDWWTAAPRTMGSGESATIDAPLESIPVFVRAGGIVPMLRDTIDTLSPATDPGIESFADDPGVLTVLIAPTAGEESRFEIFDGSVVRQSGALTVQFTPGQSFQRARLEIMKVATSVELGGRALPEVADISSVEEGWRVREGRTEIVLPAGAADVVIR